jgi:hypothetical protein
MQKWEYLTIQVEFPNGANAAPRFINGQELRDWKKIPLHSLISQLGEDGWEMTSILSIGCYLFFKRPKP